ncbi:hypothetical protein COLO4_08039 [Corchorus olitorius]|uniref:Uncharacterized protein n=1 Tax=Corchorus olitorius TaxID=93759 RepID=A0A1R3KHP2_9ROSI|nr:hypothetical protein COLO4_08039 [Corchorus olitorius]
MAGSKLQPASESPIASKRKKEETSTTSLLFFFIAKFWFAAIDHATCI